jgi:hypothetical protein
LTAAGVRPALSVSFASDRAALIYQHATRDADQRIADALSARVEAEQRKAEKNRKKDQDSDDDGSADAPVPVG